MASDTVHPLGRCVMCYTHCEDVQRQVCDVQHSLCEDVLQGQAGVGAAPRSPAPGLQ